MVHGFLLIIEKNIPFCSIVFLIFLVVYLFSCSSSSSFKMIILNVLSNSSWISIYLGSVTGTLLISFDDVMLSGSF